LGRERRAFQFLGFCTGKLPVFSAKRLTFFPLRVILILFLYHVKSDEGQNFAGGPKREGTHGLRGSGGGDAESRPGAPRGKGAALSCVKGFERRWKRRNLGGTTDFSVPLREGESIFLQLQNSRRTQDRRVQYLCLDCVSI